MILHGLLYQIRDEVFAQYLGEAGHVIDELVRVQGRDLAPEIRLAVDHLGSESPEAGVVRGEQPSGARADDRQIIKFIGCHYGIPPSTTTPLYHCRIC